MVVLVEALNGIPKDEGLETEIIVSSQTHRQAPGLSDVYNSSHGLSLIMGDVRDWDGTKEL